MNGLKAQLQKVQSDATALVNAAKGDFPTQTSAISSSLTAFENAVKALPSSPSAGQLATLASSASSFATSVKSFIDATNSKCK